jgi:hypothetical protein
MTVTARTRSRSLRARPDKPDQFRRERKTYLHEARCALPIIWFIAPTSDIRPRATLDQDDRRRRERLRL